MRPLRPTDSRSSPLDPNRYRPLLMLLICALGLGFGQASRAQDSKVENKNPSTQMTRAKIALGNTLESSPPPSDVTLSCLDIDQLTSNTVIVPAWGNDLPGALTQPRKFWVWCAHITVNGVKPNMQDAGKSFAWTPMAGPIIHPGADWGMVAPLDTVITGERLRWTTINGYKENYLQSNLSKLVIDGKTLMVNHLDWVDANQGCADAAVVGYRSVKEKMKALCADVYLVDRQPAEGANVIAVHWKTNMTCSIPVPTGGIKQRVYFAFYFRPGEETETDLWPACTSNTAEGIALEKVPSATRILLTDDLGCDQDESDSDSDPRDEKAFWIELRTTGKSVTIDPIPLDHILTYSRGDIVRPGLQLVDFYLRPGYAATRRLSCVRVTTSGAPPSA